MSILNRNLELWLALIAVLGITFIYLLVVVITHGVPPAGNFFGHAVGIIGFLLMLMTETLYSLRKRSRLAKWGRMSDWLGFHIFTGIVGPYMVLLHTSWKFNGLAEIVTFLTVLIVVSGFVGRYIYTAIPRTVDETELKAGQATWLANRRRYLSLWYTVHIPIGAVLFTTAFLHIIGALYYATFLH